MKVEAQDIEIRILAADTGEKLISFFNGTTYIVVELAVLKNIIREAERESREDH